MEPKHEGGLGFRDLYTFNLALLAKQAWRFLGQSDSIAYQVFKARYFPTTVFMEARVNANSSYVWKSMAAARLVLQKWLRWQVGDGRKTKIWHDQWLPRDS